MKKETSEKRKTWNWSEVAYKVDPNLSTPEKAYEFNNGNRVFYRPKKRR